MSTILGIFGALFALVGGFVAKRPARFFIGFGMLGLAVAMYYFGARV
jgi:hypothetical protein